MATHTSCAPNTCIYTPFRISTLAKWCYAITLQDLAEAKETGDSQKFTDAVAEYDSLTRLDAWKTQLLLRAKKRLTAVAEGDEEDLT